MAKIGEGGGSFGFDAATNSYVDLVEAGIIDPAKVVRVALDIPEPKQSRERAPEFA